MSELALDASSLHFSYPSTMSSLRFSESPSIFRDLRLRIPRGCVYGLLGPNGCGKSTLLQLALGLLAVDSGRLRVLGMDPASEYIFIRRRVGYVPQKMDLDPEMTVGESLDFVSMFFGQRWNRNVMEQALDRFGLASRSRVKIDNLSAGFRQRLSLVVALAIEPEVLVLDEPTTGLDAVVRRNFADAIIEYMAAGEQRTVIVSSHLLNEIEALVDHVGIMRGAGDSESNLLLEAPLDELKDRVLVIKALSSEGLREAKCARFLLAITGSKPVTAVYWLDQGVGRRQVLDELEAVGVQELRVGESSLDEIFVALSQQPVLFRRVATTTPSDASDRREHD